MFPTYATDWISLAVPRKVLTKLQDKDWFLDIFFTLIVPLQSIEWHAFKLQAYL